MSADSETSKLTTAEVENLLRAKYPRDRYAMFFNVPDAVSLDARRRIDAVAIGIWRSVGREVQAFELKVSRSDWLRELKHVDKADPFIAICDRFWLVTGDTSVAKLDEIPSCWGWMTATSHGLRVQRPAQKLPTDRENMPWGFTVGLLRKLHDDLLASPDVRAHIDERVKVATSFIERRIESETRRDKQALTRNLEAIAEFERASGIPFNPYSMGDVGALVGQLQRLRNGVRGDGLDMVGQLLAGQAAELRNALANVEKARDAVRALMPTSEPT